MQKILKSPKTCNFSTEQCSGPIYHHVVLIYVAIYVCVCVYICMYIYIYIYIFFFFFFL